MGSSSNFNKMKKPVPAYLVILLSLIFTLLFFKHTLGLNLFLFEAASIFILFWLKKIKLKNTITLVLFCCLIITSLFFVINYSALALWINLLVFFIFIGSAIYQSSKSVVSSFLVAGSNIPGSIQSFFAKRNKGKARNEKHFVILKWIKIIIIPLVIIFVFVLIYQASNPIFKEGLNKFTAGISDGISKLFTHIDFALFFTLLLGFIVSIYILSSYREKTISNIDADASDTIIRKRKRWYGNKIPSLKNEVRSGIFLLAILNALILIVNIIDIYWVWFNFSWNGQYLKQFVHEGTYLLILSILLSIGIVLYFFRGNINFYTKKKHIVWLSYLWLAQNSILTISVLVRNYWYIEYFNLAYKRIGVFVFLALTLFGIYTVYQKVRGKRSTFYLLRLNGLALIIALTLTSTVNWDNLIAKYNFKHYTKAFVHFDFLSELSDKTLPYLDIPEDRLMEIDSIQSIQFPFELKYLCWEAYHKRIEIRKETFMNKWKSKDFLSWNLAEYLAYDKIKKKKGQAF
jgi:Domain of unknown function (DUF4153)